METKRSIDSLVSYPIVDSIPLPGNRRECLVIAKCEATKDKHFDSWLIGYANPDDTHLSLKRVCEGLEFRDYNEALNYTSLMLSQE